MQETTVEIYHSLNNDTGRMNEDLMKQVKSELINNSGIPYSYNRDLSKMTCAIHYVTDWENGFIFDIDRATYNYAVEALIEMACESSLRTYNKRTVSYKNVIDKVNQNMDREGIMSIRYIIAQAVQDYQKRANKEEIEHPKNYLKSCIFESFDTYKIKFDSYFSRTYYRQN